MADLHIELWARHAPDLQPALDRLLAVARDPELLGGSPAAHDVGAAAPDAAAASRRAGGAVRIRCEATSVSVDAVDAVAADARPAEGHQPRPTAAASSPAPPVPGHEFDLADAARLFTPEAPPPGAPPGGTAGPRLVFFDLPAAPPEPAAGAALPLGGTAARPHATGASPAPGRNATANAAAPARPRAALQRTAGTLGAWSDRAIARLAAGVAAARARASRPRQDAPTTAPGRSLRRLATPSRISAVASGLVLAALVSVGGWLAARESRSDAARAAAATAPVDTASSVRPGTTGARDAGRADAQSAHAVAANGDGGIRPPSGIAAPPSSPGANTATRPAPGPVSTLPSERAQPGLTRRPAVGPRTTPTAKPTAFVGTLEVRSTPPGASVTVNNRTVGTTPLVLADFPAGTHAVRVESAGFQRWSRAVLVSAGKHATLDAALVKAPGGSSEP